MASLFLLLVFHRTLQHLRVSVCVWPSAESKLTCMSTEWTDVVKPGGETPTSTEIKHQGRAKSKY